MVWEFFRNLRSRSTDDPRPLPYVDPLQAGRHPFQIYMLALCVISGAPYLFGYATAEAVDKQLPVFLALAWGILLLFGAIIALVGVYWRWSIANALTMERIGLGAVGGAAMVYGLCIVGARSLTAPVLVVGIGVAFMLLRVPVSSERWSPRTGRIIEDAMTVAGLVLLVGCLIALVMSPARVILAGAAVILGFGLSCVTRARDIGKIFHRANEIQSSRVLREPEEPEAPR